MNEWSILIYLATAGVGALAFLSVVRDEIRLKTYEINELVEAVRKERQNREEEDDDAFADDAEPIEVQPAPGVMETPAMLNIA